MTRENLEKCKALVLNARHILGDIEYCQVLLDRFKSLLNTDGGITFIGDKACLYLFKTILGEERENRPDLTEDKTKILNACIEILEARIARLENEFANLPSLESKTSSDDETSSSGTGDDDDL